MDDNNSVVVDKVNETIEGVVINLQPSVSVWDINETPALSPNEVVENNRIYVNVTASLNLTNSNVGNKFILKNTGYVIFKQLLNSVVVNVVTEPLRNGSSTALMIKDPTNGYTISVEYKDRLSNPLIQLSAP